MFSGRYATRQGTYEVVTLVCRVVIPEFITGNGPPIISSTYLLVNCANTYVTVKKPDSRQDSVDWVEKRLH